jgi:hypothetical protein
MLKMMALKHKEVLMIKAYSRIMVVLAAAILLAAPALAGPWNVNDSITFSLATQVVTPFGSGGLFTITNSNSGDKIKTFCIELNEFIYQNDLVAGISNSAVNGGRAGGSPDPISSSTDWLYAQYTDGNATYNNTSALQIAFWILEDEVTAVEAASWFNPAMLAIASGYTADALLYGTGSYGTQVLNLKDASGALHQSQLFRSIPEPATMFLLGLGIIGLAGIRRKIK